MGTQKLGRLVTRRATHWFDDLQQASLRNAMVASTALAQRRHENLEVEEFLAFHEHRVEAHQGITMQHAVQRTG